MWRVIKILFYLVLLAVIAMVGFAYLGPLFGVDFSAPAAPVTQPIDLLSN